MLDSLDKNAGAWLLKLRYKRQYITKGFHMALSWEATPGNPSPYCEEASSHRVDMRADISRGQSSFQLPLLKAKRTRDKLSLLCCALFSIYFCIFCKTKSQGDRHHCGRVFMYSEKYNEWSHRNTWNICYFTPLASQLILGPCTVTYLYSF